MARLNRIKIVNFRNIEKQSLEIGGRQVCLWGDNAHGKTNFLEALYLSANIRPFRPGKQDDWIKQEAERATVIAEYTGENGDFDVKYRISRKNNREYLLNDKKTSSLKDIFLRLRIVAYVPTSYEVVMGTDVQRRSFFDKACFSIDPTYLSSLIYYNKTLLNRNAALKAKNNHKLWDDAFSKTASIISKVRKRAANQVEKHVKTLFCSFFEDAQDIEIRYKSSAGFSYDEVMENLEKSLNKDINYGYTNTGSHRDIYEIKLKGMGAKKIVSTGQAKLLSFLLKLAKCRMIRGNNGLDPIFLFDDVTAFLDEARFGKLVSLLMSEGMQVIFTSVDKTLFETCFGNSVQLMKVQEGRILYGG